MHHWSSLQERPLAETAWLKELNRNLPAAVLCDIVAKLLDNPQTQQLTQAVITDCRTEHNCSLRNQARQLVAQHVPEPSEGSYLYAKPHLGMLSESLSDLDNVLDIAQRWLALGGYEATFHLIIACADKGADYGGRGNDSMCWEEFDERADDLLSDAIAHIADDWDLDLETAVKDMEADQKCGNDTGYETVWCTALPALERRLATKKQP